MTGVLDCVIVSLLCVTLMMYLLTVIQNVYDIYEAVAIKQTKLCFCFGSFLYLK